MMKYIVITIFVLILTACGASHRQVRGPDGKDWFIISCKRNHTNCLEEAGDVCSTGYDVADSSGSNGTFSYASVNQYGGYAYTVPTYRGQMIIRCK